MYSMTYYLELIIYCILFYVYDIIWSSKWISMIYHHRIFINDDVFYVSYGSKIYLSASYYIIRNNECVGIDEYRIILFLLFYRLT